MASPRPKPTALKILEGNPGKRPLNAREPQPEPGIPECPEHLTGDARKEWERITPLLDAVGLLSEMDMAGVAGYCQAWGHFVDANRKLNRHGILLKGKTEGEYTINPYYRVAQDASKELRQYLDGLGLSPSSRTRITMLPERVKKSAMQKLLEEG